jgi:hypothetical protein
VAAAAEDALNPKGMMKGRLKDRDKVQPQTQGAVTAVHPTSTITIKIVSDGDQNKVGKTKSLGIDAKKLDCSIGLRGSS